MEQSLKGKTLFITGASRGIGLAIALSAAKEGANIAVIAKTDTPHPKLPGTIHTAVQEIEQAGGQALAIQTDIRFDDQVQSAIDKTVERFGGIDILVNNASALSMSNTLSTPMKRFDLMNQVNARGTFLCSKLCHPYLRKAVNPHILMVSPPLKLDPSSFAMILPWALAKMGMSLCVLGMAEEFKADGIAVNALWPKTVIATAAVQNVVGGDAMMKQSRKAEIMGDAARYLLRRNASDFTGQFCLDETILTSEGVSDFDQYAIDPGSPLVDDFFV